MLRAFLFMLWVGVIIPPAYSQYPEYASLVKMWSEDTGVNARRSEFRDSLLKLVSDIPAAGNGTRRVITGSFIDSFLDAHSPESRWLIEEYSLCVYLYLQGPEITSRDVDLLQIWFERFIEHTVLLSEPDRAMNLFPIARIILDQYARQCPDRALSELLLMIDRLRLAEALIYTFHLAIQDKDSPMSLRQWIKERVRISNSVIPGLSGQLDISQLEQIRKEWQRSFPGISHLIDQCVRMESGGWSVPADRSWVYYFVTEKGSWVFTFSPDRSMMRKFHLGDGIDWAGMIDRWYDGLLTYHTPRVFPKIGDYANWHKNWLTVNYELREKLALDQSLDPEAILIPDGPLEYFSWKGILSAKVSEGDERNFRAYDYLDMPTMISAGLWDKASYANQDPWHRDGAVMEEYAQNDASYAEPLEFRREHLGDLDFLKKATPPDVEFGSMSVFQDHKEDRVDWRALFLQIKLGGERSLWYSGQIEGASENSFEWYALAKSRTAPLFMPATEVLPGPAVIRRLALSMKIWNTPGVLFCYWRIPEPLTKQFASTIWPLWKKDIFPPDWLRKQGRELYSRGSSNLFQDPYFLDPWMYYTPFPSQPGMNPKVVQRAPFWGSVMTFASVAAGLAFLIFIRTRFVRKRIMERRP